MTSRLRRFFRLHVRGSLMLSLLGASLLFLFVWQQAAVDRLVVRIEREQARNAELTSDVNALRYEVHALASHGQVTERASAELNMRRPDNDQIVQLAFPKSEGFAIAPLVGEANAGTRDGQ